MPKLPASTDGLELLVPESEAGSTLLRSAAGRSLQVARRPIPEHLSVARLWPRLVNGDDPAGRLEEVGDALARHLFGDHAIELLTECLEDARRDGRPRRIVLSLPLALMGFPWEAMLVPGIPGPLGTHKLLTVVRRPNTSAAHTPLQERGYPYLELIGVSYSGLDPGLDALETAAEIAAIWEELGSALDSATLTQMRVAQDPEGSFRALRARVAQHGAPDILHFAGHGLDDGRGLRFSDGSVHTEQLAQLLLDGALGRCRLAVLNACATATPARGAERALQPFGPLSFRLVDAGLAESVGVLGPLLDQDGLLFARTFYNCLARQATTDVAVQAARRELLMTSQERIGHAFITLVNPRALPAPLMVFAGADPRARARYFDFAFAEQRRQIGRLFISERSSIGLVHGSDRMGHTYVLERAHHDLVANVDRHWVPVPVASWSPIFDATLGQQALLEAIARGIGIDISEQSTPAEVMDAVIHWLTTACRGGVLVVIEFRTNGYLTNQVECEAIETFASKLWPSLLDRAGASARTKTVFLLSVIYPETKWWKPKPARKLVARLSGRANGAHFGVDVVDELTLLTKKAIALGMTELLTIERAEAERLAEGFSAGGNNEYALQRIADFFMNTKRRQAQ